MKKQATAILLAAVGLAFAGHAAADEFEDSLQDVLQAWQAGDYRKAGQELEYAKQLVQDVRLKALAGALPEALDGWTVVEEKSGSPDAALAMFGGGGGGITVGRSYESASKGSVKITIQGESPMISQIMAVLGNPQMVTATGGRIVKLGRERGMLSKKGQLHVSVDNEYLVTIEPKGSATGDDATAYGKAVDYELIKSF